MIKLKFAKQLQNIASIDKSLIEHIQGMTDNLYQVLNRGLSYDTNLNSKIVTVNVTSLRTFILNSKELTSLSGAVIINTNGAKVNGFKYNKTNRGDLECEVDLDRNTSTITFLLIGG